MTQVYLSPHLDDAALSCGGVIHRQRQAGEPVSVITVFAGEPAAGESLSPFALEQHGYWGRPPRPARLRRAEDAAALALLDADVVHLDYLDAVYRRPPGGPWPYVDRDTLFGPPHSQDPLPPRAIAQAVVERLPAGPGLVIHAPLAAGGHVDHVVVRLAARQLVEWGYDLDYYEDYPYAERAGAVEQALSAVDGRGPDRGWVRSVVALDRADLTAKVAALGYYRSQMWILFDSAEAMPSRVWAFSAGRCPEAALAECLWWPAGARQEV